LRSKMIIRTGMTSMIQAIWKIKRTTSLLHMALTF
jgi:hypothetical protein